MTNNKIKNIYKDTERLILNTIQIMKDGDSKEKAFCEGMKEALHYLKTTFEDAGIETK